MQEIDLNLLHPRLQLQVAKARRAIHGGHPAYAVDICLQILRREPGCLPVRKILRSAQKANQSSNNGESLKVFKTVCSLAVYLWNKVLPGKNPHKTMDLAERILKRDIENIRARQMLASTAHSLGLSETKLFALEEIRNYRPHDIDNLLALGHTYLVIGRLADAEKAGDSILKLEPMHGAARSLVKRASVSRTIQIGGWDRL